jgi:hypothetical protein
VIQRDILISKMARFVAGLPPTVTRGQEEGTYEAAIGFLRTNATTLLNDLADPATFKVQLDKRTHELRSHLPSRSWGVARKCLNIFIRDAAYNFCLRREHKLERLEPSLEIPLDSNAARGLREKRSDLPRWQTIKALTCATNTAYQAAAAEIARHEGVFRVHLDVWYWRADS